MKLRKLRKQKGISQTYIAQKLGFKYPSGYCNIEMGRIQLKLDHAKIICEILGVTLETLSEDEVESFLSA
jgi:transcriptional regulator with XRE-family HTH domain